MNNFYFQNPTKILFGKDMTENLGDEIEVYKRKKVLIVTGRSSSSNYGYTDIALRSLIKKSIEYVLFTGIRTNPDVGIIRKAIHLAKENRVDAILAIGGGSVIDSVKLIAAGYFYSGDPWDLVLNSSLVSDALPIFVVLTLSASGSEMNSIAIISNNQESRKLAFSAGNLTYPKVSIIDPSFQYSLPRRMIVNGIVDSITHVLEYYFNGVKNVDIQDRISEGLILTLLDHGKNILKYPDHYESRAQIAWCSTLALNGLNATGRYGGDFASHTIEHAISGLYPAIYHAEGLSAIFPNWMRYVYKYDVEKFFKFSKNIFNLNCSNKKEIAIKGINELKIFFKEIGAPTRLRDLAINQNDLPAIAKYASVNGKIGKLKSLNEIDVLNILEDSY